jgi:thiol:disulfide interchange protein DsbA
MKSKQLTFFLLLTFLTFGVFATDSHAEGASSKKSSPHVIFETSKGSFTLELFPDKAPITVVNFLRYVDEGFYDNTIFHRAIPDFVIQGGGFEKGMKYKEPRSPIKNESSNRLKNLTGTISLARRTHPDTGTSQFYINLKHNASLDYKSDLQPGYTVFGKISKGMDVINKIGVVPTGKFERFKDVPKEDVKLISVKREVTVASEKAGTDVAVVGQKPVVFVEGVHYRVLHKPVPTRDSSKIEVVEMFSYGCPHCYEFEPFIKDWARHQGNEIDFWFFPAVWNKPMNMFARAYYAAEKLKVLDKTHMPLFTALVIQHKTIRNENDLADFFAKYGVDRENFLETINSDSVKEQAKHAESLVKKYKPVGTPEVVINGKYRVDRMHAGGITEMLSVIDFLIEKERKSLSNKKK